MRAGKQHFTQEGVTLRDPVLTKHRVLYKANKILGAVNRAASMIADLNGTFACVPQSPDRKHRHNAKVSERLFEHMRSVGLPPERLDPAEAVVKAAAGRLTVHPNLDLALAAFVHAAGLEADAAEWLFATARTAGWIAHAIEEYAERPVRFRPRSVYLPACLAGS